MFVTRGNIFEFRQCIEANSPHVLLSPSIQVELVGLDKRRIKRIKLSKNDKHLGMEQRKYCCLLNWKTFRKWFGMIQQHQYPSLCVIMQTNGKFHLTSTFLRHICFLCKTFPLTNSISSANNKALLLCTRWNITVNISFDWITLDSREKSRSRIQKKRHTTVDWESHSLWPNRDEINCSDIYFVWGKCFICHFSLFVINLPN